MRPSSRKPLFLNHWRPNKKLSKKKIRLSRNTTFQQKTLNWPKAVKDRCGDVLLKVNDVILLLAKLLEVKNPTYVAKWPRGQEVGLKARGPQLEPECGPWTSFFVFQHNCLFLFYVLVFLSIPQSKPYFWRKIAIKHQGGGGVNRSRPSMLVGTT